MPVLCTSAGRSNKTVVRPSRAVICLIRLAQIPLFGINGSAQVVCVQSTHYLKERRKQAFTFCTDRPLGRWVPEWQTLKTNVFLFILFKFHIASLCKRGKLKYPCLLILDTKYTFVIRCGFWLPLGWRSRKIMKHKFKFRKSVHHHTIQINQPTRCNNFSSLLLDVYLQLNMFRASSYPSSGAQQLHKQPLVLPSERGDSNAVGRVRTGRPDHDQQH